MQSPVVYGMILNSVKEGGVLGTVNVQIHDVAVRSVSESFESLLLNCESGVLYAIAINYARDFACSAHFAHVSFAAKRSFGTGECKMFH